MLLITAVRLRPYYYYLYLVLHEMVSESSFRMGPPLIHLHINGNSLRDDCAVGNNDLGFVPKIDLNDMIT